MIKAVLFDLDGTIIDNEKFTIISKVIEGKKIGYDISEETAKRTLGMSTKNSKALFQSIYGEDFPYEYFRQKRFEYIVNDVKENGLKLKEGVNEIISFCHKFNIKMAICTSSTMKYINAYKEHSNLFDNFDYIVTGEDIKNGKPNPEIFQRAIDHFGIENQEALIVEDSINGIKAGINAKTHVIMVPDLVEPTEEIKNFNIKILKSLINVIEYIQEVNTKGE